MILAYRNSQCITKKQAVPFPPLTPKTVNLEGVLTDLGETLEGDVPEHGHVEELVDEGGDELGLKDVAQGDPVQEPEQRVQRGADQRGVLGVVLHNETHSGCYNRVMVHGHRGQGKGTG